MLIDPETLRITAILDFEFTNAIPAKFAYDPPWWLLLSGPEMWLECCAIEEFLTFYEHRIEQFLRALERVEIEWHQRSNNPVDRLSLPGCAIHGELGDFGSTMRQGRALI